MAELAQPGMRTGQRDAVCGNDAHIFMQRIPPVLTVPWKLKTLNSPSDPPEAACGGTPHDALSRFTCSSRGAHEDHFLCCSTPKHTVLEEAQPLIKLLSL
ncbi:hypothetical protein VZT92_016199 [Zoarces viviparus]|uniref:Uncharacterized protein n=1 Tax=Zoarces viviparus TaxID=48416 RepID=A0AAW1ETJ8_ZOAVI